MPSSNKRDGLVELERTLAGVLRNVDPANALREAQADETLSKENHQALASIDPDGLVIASLIMVRLRFERLLRGSVLAGQWFESDPAAFADAFKRYHTTIAPHWMMPSEEAAAFESWHAEEA